MTATVTAGEPPGTLPDLPVQAGDLEYPGARYALEAGLGFAADCEADTAAAEQNVGGDGERRPAWRSPELERQGLERRGQDARRGRARAAIVEDE